MSRTIGINSRATEICDGVLEIVNISEGQVQAGFARGRLEECRVVGIVVDVQDCQLPIGSASAKSFGGKSSGNTTHFDARIGELGSRRKLELQSPIAAYTIH